MTNTASTLETLNPKPLKSPTTRESKSKKALRSRGLLLGDLDLVSIPNRGTFREGTASAYRDTTNAATFASAKDTNSWRPATGKRKRLQVESRMWAEGCKNCTKLVHTRW